MDVDVVYNERDNCSDHDGEKDSSHLSEVESVHALIDAGECLEEGIVDPVCEGGVAFEEQDCRNEESDF